MTKPSSYVKYSRAIERDVMGKLGGVRLPQGAYQGPGDIDGDLGWAAVQIKQRIWPAWVREGWRQITEATAGRLHEGLPVLPLLVLCDKPGPGREGRTLICLDIDDWVQWMGKSQTESAN